jgi:hypothetical protein
VTVTVRRACPDRGVAERLRAAVAADNPGFVEVHVVGTVLEIRLTAGSPASARATLEDLLACLKAAEGAAGLAPR